MAKITLLIFLILVSTNSFSEEDSWAGQWWENVYQQRIVKDEYLQYQQKSVTRCQTKVDWCELPPN